MMLLILLRKGSVKTSIIKLSKLKNNVGQIEGLPKNPRLIKDDRFIKLVKSIKDDPEMLELRELIVYPFEDNFIVVGGNMRLKAMKELGYKEAPCKILDENTPLDKLKAYTIKDNVPFGENDWELLGNEWDLDQLDDWGLEVPDLNLEEEEEKEDKDLSDSLKSKYILEIECESEAEQEILYNRFLQEKLKVKILT